MLNLVPPWAVFFRQRFAQQHLVVTLDLLNPLTFSTKMDRTVGDGGNLQQELMMSVDTHQFNPFGTEDVHYFAVLMWLNFLCHDQAQSPRNLRAVDVKSPPSIFKQKWSKSWVLIVWSYERLGHHQTLIDCWAWSSRVYPLKILVVEGQTSSHVLCSVC